MKFKHAAIPLAALALAAAPLSAAHAEGWHHGGGRDGGEWHGGDRHEWHDHDWHGDRDDGFGLAAGIGAIVGAATILAAPPPQPVYAAPAYGYGYPAYYPHRVVYAYPAYGYYPY